MASGEPEPSSQVSLRPAPHQVAGHRFDEGRAGSLVDTNGRFYKPLQSGDRGDAEANFYKKISADPNLPPSVAKFFPGFFGVVDAPGAGQGAPEDLKAATKYLVMEDLTAGYSKPCIIDIKMGRRTWFEGAAQAYIDKCLVKDAETTSGVLGYRIAGLQSYDKASGAIWKADRTWCKKVSVEGMPASLAKFLSSEPCGEGILDRTLASQVLQGEDGLLTKLQQLRAWFDTQTSYQLYSASILAIYEADPEALSAGGGRRVSLRLVDFAHVTELPQKDVNFLEAIDAVVTAFEDLLS